MPPILVSIDGRCMIVTARFRMFDSFAVHDRQNESRVYVPLELGSNTCDRYSASGAVHSEHMPRSDISILTIT